MAKTIRVLETVTRVAPLGLRFCDEATGAFVGDGLDVAVHPVARPERRVKAVANRSGIYVACELPGLRDLESGAGDDRYWADVSAATTEAYIVRVEDTGGRFLPFQFRVRLPARGLVEWVCDPGGSPPVLPRFVPLYSAPARPVPSGMAVVRAQLLDSLRRAPAAAAVLEVHAGDQPPARGLADERGRVAVILPYPEPLRYPVESPPTSPPAGSRRPLSQQSWRVAVSARYSPALGFPESPDQRQAHVQQRRPEPPDLCQALAQPTALLWSGLSPDAPLTEATLEFGKELILKTKGHSELLIEPPGSPP